MSDEKKRSFVSFVWPVMIWLTYFS